MSLKTFINKYKNQNTKSSQSSAASFSTISSTSFAPKGQVVPQNSQNSQNFSQQTSTIFSQQLPSSAQKNQYTIIDEGRIASQNLNKSYQVNKQASTYNSKSTSIPNSFLQDQPTYENQIENNDSFFIQSQNLNNSAHMQNLNGLNLVQQNLNQSQLFLPTIQESKVTMFDGGQSQVYYHQEPRLIKPNLNQSNVYLSQFSQQQQMATIQFQLLQDEIQKQKVEQKERELLLKQELLSEMKDLKQYFKSSVISELEEQNEKVQKTQVECKQHFEKVHKKVENVVTKIFDYLKDDKLGNRKKIDVAGSQYAQDISDLFTTVNQIKDLIDVAPQTFQQNIQSDLNKGLQIIFTKINQAKRSVKKQVVQSTAKPVQKRKKRTKQVKED